MEFSYRLTEKMYLEAFSLHFWRLWRKIAFSFIAVIALLEFFFLSLAIRDGLSSGEGLFSTLESDGVTPHLFLFSLVVILSGVVLLMPRWRIIRIYRKNPERDGIILVTVTSEHLDVAIEGTGNSCFKWSFYKYWREGKNVIVLTLYSGQYQLLPKSGLSEAQQDELRGILTAALPKK
jgi:hypothetical protein